jgi:predicted membrane metal-binding protein
MARLETFRSQAWAALYLVAAIVIVTAVALSATGLIALLLAVGFILALPYVAGYVLGLGRKQVATRRAPFAFSNEPASQISIITAEGATRAAKLVPVEQTENYRFVLTRDGYMLVNEQGRAIHTLRQDDAA